MEQENSQINNLTLHLKELEKEKQRKPKVVEGANTHPSQTLPKNCKGRNTPKLILRGHHHPDTKTRQRYYRKRKLQTNITDEYRCKNRQQNTRNGINNILKGSYTMIKWDLSQGCKDSSIYANQSM